ncbi:GntR family transcriptional regulator [Caloranaerobacter azorensis]|uniref:GntR family transcriptional regulator n=1 Tax=Caloranaerobacter azorensis TaxID=116090 RepID=A0A6P1YFP4_9FIRM|nr:GntR family transcriptional regulator [Caloranaerobacter azorensis]QIB27742.1 GntR family transcriptional regulator [Caloranaerobacter azorensis]
MNKDLDKLKLHDYKPLREIVFESLREAIIDGKLKPGERLMEVQLAEKLGVSRTPVREAIRKLELEGLVVMIPRKGAYVADVSIKDILEVLEIRASLEGLAAQLAAERITDDELEALKMKAREFDECIKNKDIKCIIQKDVEFHDIIFKATRNEKLIAIAESLREQVQRFRIIYVTEYDGTAKLSEEHSKIIEAISKRDSKKAKYYAEIHIENAEDYIIKMTKSKMNKRTGGVE